MNKEHCGGLSALCECVYTCIRPKYLGMGKEKVPSERQG